MAIGMTASGLCAGTSLDGSVDALVVQADGRILIGGGFTQVGGVPRDNLARLHSNGSLDPGFVPHSGPASHIGGLAVQPDGSVIASANLHIGGSYEPHLFRLSSNGVVDAGFADISGNGLAAAIVVQPDGKVAIGGDFDRVGDQPHFNGARINVDGTVDAAFTPFFARGNTGAVWTIGLQADGKLLFGGEFPYVDSQRVFGLARLAFTGLLDSTFTWDSQFTNNLINAISLQPDGQILIGGGFATGGLTVTSTLARLHADGSTDVPFSTNASLATLLDTRSMARLPDGRILIGGFHGQGSQHNVQRINADGTLDTAFHPVINDMVQCLAVQADGKILIGGTFTQVNGAPLAYLARLNANGSTDPDFVVDGHDAIFGDGFD